jgi:CheY-like chemotaxis protein
MPKVLVVESDANFAEHVLRGLYERWPAVEVEVIGDGQTALQSAVAFPPDLILLCVELPKISGYSICNKLKKNPQLKGIPSRHHVVRSDS